jgi:dipeptidase E
MATLLLLSNSTMPGNPFLSWPRPFIREVIQPSMKVLFIPYAAVTFSFDEYEEKVKQAFHEMGIELKSLHHQQDKSKAVEDADAIAIGGGNTFALLARLYQENLIDPIKKKVASGAPFMGWSAGCNVACPTIMTTNDMPIIQPASFAALNFVPFQVNPHYTEFKQSGHGGETRMQRIEEFLVMNPHRKVVGLPEGTLLSVSNDKIELKGEGNAKLFEAGKPPAELVSGSDVSLLLKKNS